MSARIEIENISKRYGSYAALDDVSLSFDAGSFVVLLGPSGSGKTTLLSVLGGFTAPDSGRVLLNGSDVTAMAPAIRPTTTVFQDYALFPHMTIGENVGFGLRMRRTASAQRHAKAAEMLALVGLPDAFGKKPHQLSGGQRQRVALARALAVDPEVLLLDEPLGALDLRLRRQMQDELKQLQRRIGTTFVHVTHDQEEAMAIADTLVVLNKGRIEDMGPPDRVYLKPKSRFAAEFMGLSTLIEGRIAQNGLSIETALGPLAIEPIHALPAAASVTLCIRPEDVRISETPETVPLGLAIVRDAAFLGAHRKIIAESVPAPGMLLTLLLPHDSRVSAGEAIPLFVCPKDIGIIPAAAEDRS
jgi:spermidine/putrescine transport system ATP-binding protein